MRQRRFIPFRRFRRLNNETTMETIDIFGIVYVAAFSIGFLAICIGAAISIARDRG